MNLKITQCCLVAVAMLMHFTADAFNVTFRVDMSQQTGFTTPEVNGTFNNWCGNCFQMTDVDGDNIWEGNTNLAPGNYQYKFSADNWHIQETLIPGGTCTVTASNFTNRTLAVTADVVLPVVCWGACVDCANAPVFYDVTFQVDMNQQTGFTIPEVNGSFNGWCGNCNPLQDTNGDGIWTTTITLLGGDYEYKYSHDTWSGQETLAPGSPCTQTTDTYTNRVLSLTQDVVLPVVCYGSCAACGIDIGPFPVTFSVDMSQVSGFITPEVNGTFNGWCGNCTPMSDADGDNIWTVDVPMYAGSYEYKFSFDNWTGQENLTPGGSCMVTTETFTNRAIDVTGPTDIGVVCWESCLACNTIVLNQMDLPVTFDDASVEYGLIGFDGSEASSIVVDPTDALNMVAQVVKSATAGASSGVTITAPSQLGFSSPIPFMADATTMSVRVWSPDAGIQVRLKVEDHADPTHSVETNVTTSVANDWETLVFDFSNESAGTAALDLGYAYDKATIFFNFGVDGATAGEKIYYFDDVVFGGEAVVVNEYSVTFQVDMQNVTGFSIPEVNGTFNGWCGGCFQLADGDGDGIWTGTAMIPEGVYEYKFAYDSWAGQETLLAGSSCTITTGDFTNRSLEVAGDITLPVVCWESCDACGVAPTMHAVTFQVDMQNVTNFTTPEVNGTFNNWCGGCFPLTDADGDGIWTGTAMIPEGAQEYKFAYDAWAGQENLIPGLPCTVTNFGFTNRSIAITGDTLLPVVCWEACTDCATAPSNYSVTFQVDMNGVIGFTTPEVNGTFNNWCGNCFTMTDANGDNIWEATTTMQEGSYQFKYSYDNWVGSEQLTAGDPCTVSDGTFVNRALNLSSDTTLAVVCWAQCDPCSAPEPVSVTLNVDLGSVSATSVEVSGTFNGYCVGCQPLTALGNNQYTITMDVLPGAHYYRFTVNGGTVIENLAEGTCTVGFKFGVVRELIASEDVNVGMVCWESCAPCLTSVGEELTPEFELYPNPAHEVVRIKTSAGNANYRLLDATGRIVATGSANGSSTIDVDTRSLSEGFYSVQIDMGGHTAAKPLVIQH
jgi:1,4-alpha-glucan branching enzyme